ncbi:3'-5'-exoribonuclease [Elasticomyces elasticus]|nr:3'-5'-exoribonuclease [Elasticomyces elasticus]KAK5009883.1 hypothetical protein LTR28_012927 [Elasticomyces elasticus]
MNDRRRINPPPGGTTPPAFLHSINATNRPVRTRPANLPRRIFLQTGLVPSASGSAYLELQSSSTPLSNGSLIPTSSSPKITCTVHGPRPLPRSAPFSSSLVLSTHVKFAPFATRLRRGYVRDASERDLGVHLETALRGVILGERWPKSGVEVVITVLEGEEDAWWADDRGEGSGAANAGWGMMSVLAACITAASAALVDAGIDCVDMITGGVAAIVRSTGHATDATVNGGSRSVVVLDPCPSEHEYIQAACVVGYLEARDEVTELWMRGDAGSESESLLDQAVQAAILGRTVLSGTMREVALLKFDNQAAEINPHNATDDATGREAKSKDVVMTG